MKLAKMSLAAALLLGVNAFAIENVQVNGAAKVFYETVDNDGTGVNNSNAFNSDASGIDFALDLGLTADLTENVSAGVMLNAVSNLGMENSFAEGVWSGTHEAEASNGQINDAMWLGELWIAAKGGETTLKLGRQTLDTPLVFTEEWSISNNTFEAAMVINEDLPNTTIAAGYVGKSNGVANDIATTGAGGYVTSVGGEFNSFYNGAYVLGVVNNSYEPLTAQSWFYSVQGIADAYWLQADVSMDALSFGLQYAYMDQNVGHNDSAWAAMLGYEIKDTVSLMAAYSSVDEDGSLGFGNLATGTDNGGQTKLYTEMWWWYGTVSAIGADSLALSASTTVGDGYDLFLGYYHSDVNPTDPTIDFSVDEVAFTVSKSYGPLDTSVAILYDDIDDTFGVDTEKVYTYQLYLTYNF